MERSRSSMVNDTSLYPPLRWRWLRPPTRGSERRSTRLDVQVSDWTSAGRGTLDLRLVGASDECEEELLEVLVVRTPATLGRDPVDHLVRVHDVAGLAVHAVARVDLEVD